MKSVENLKRYVSTEVDQRTWIHALGDSLVHQQ